MQRFIDDKLQAMAATQAISAPRTSHPHLTLAHSDLSVKGPEVAKLNHQERAAINSGRWFASLSSMLKHDILRCTYVRRLKDGELIHARGEPAKEWLACAKGAVRVSSISITGRQTSLTYVEPGIWFGDTAILDGDMQTHDAFAHGSTTLLCVARADFHRIMSEHPELAEAILRQNARRIQQLYGLVEDLNCLPLRARLAKQVLVLARSHGATCVPEKSEIRIGLRLGQEDLAQLVGASRQRVNQELKTMERAGVLRVEVTGLVIQDRHRLVRISDCSG